ncbi:MAG: OmpA family protein [Proteobacteria bacterium]|nr:OmpA family protein [Pseudomonadota bacterium]
MPPNSTITRLISLFATLALGLLLAGCTDYDVPGGDKPWPKLSEFPDRPDPEETDRRRRKLYQQYGDLERALPEPTERPIRPPDDALKVAIIQFPRAGADLDEGTREVLSQVAAYAQRARANVMLFGYSSLSIELASGGSAKEAARGVAEARLRAVGVVLVEDGVPIDRIQLIARGNVDPVYFESDPAGEAGNRRVEIWFTR